MKNYELNYIISPNSTETELKEVSEKIKSFLQKQNALLAEITEPKKKNQVLLGIFDFSIDPEKIKDLEKELKLENKIIRYMIIAKKLPEKETEKRRPGNEPADHPAKAGKVELKEIDKKIEEILQ